MQLGHLAYEGYDLYDPESHVRGDRKLVRKTTGKIEYQRDAHADIQV